MQSVIVEIIAHLLKDSYITVIDSCVICLWWDKTTFSTFKLSFDGASLLSTTVCIFNCDILFLLTVLYSLFYIAFLSVKESHSTSDDNTKDLWTFSSVPSGLRQSTPQVRPTPLICRTSSTASSREDRLMTWLPMGASSPQVPLLTSHPGLEHPHSPLQQARRASTCRGVNGQSPASPGPRAASLREGRRKSANPSRGEVSRPFSL